MSNDSHAQATLASLPEGKRAVVCAISGHGAYRRRLLEMGLIPGTTVQMVRTAPLGDPIEVRLRGFSLSLRRKDAAQVHTSSAAIVNTAATTENGQFNLHSVKAPQSQSTEKKRILLVGNPNSGKTTLFNRLSGKRSKVGNYPGVTVEKKSAELTLSSSEKVELIDLPGTYSLRANSPEERVAVDAVLGRKTPAPDLVVMVADATSLSRNLYLATQLAESPTPLLIALNMWDEKESLGLDINLESLQKGLGVCCVPISATSGQGLDELRAQMQRMLTQNESRSVLCARYDARIEEVLGQVENEIPEAWHHGSAARKRLWASWALLSIGEDELHEVPDSLRSTIRDLCEEHKKDPSPMDQDMIRERYAFIDNLLRQCAQGTLPIARRELQDRLDRFLLQPVIGTLVFLTLVFILFQSLFLWVEPAISAIETSISFLQNLVQNTVPSGSFQDLIVNGVLAGVGNVIAFVPQIALLFFMISA
ncbi:MAG: 50S ribosome-binding GTPase [Myxococcales bacterium]|nr:MAG: 50S ribosome-binding GTPase [Myxococcales bacterium]